jgi:hypothetical protein
MTVKEMIEALQALDMPNALVVRDSGTGSGHHRYHERGSNWDVLIVHQRKDAMAKGMWFPDTERNDSEYTRMWAVVI